MSTPDMDIIGFAKVPFWKRLMLLPESSLAQGSELDTPVAGPGSGSRVWQEDMQYLLRQSWRQLSGPFLLPFTPVVLVKVSCILSNVFFQTSSFPEARYWQSRRSTGNVDAAPYVGMAVNGFQWCFYGIFASLLTRRCGFLVLLHSNCLGALLGAYYVTIFYGNCWNERTLGRLQTYLTLVASLAVAQTLAVLLLPPWKALFLTGSVGAIAGFIGAFSMVAGLPEVVKTEDGSSISAVLLWSYLGSCVAWLACGWLLEDALVMAPNITGILTSCIALMLKYHYGSEVLPRPVAVLQKQGDEDGSNTKGSIAELPSAIENRKGPVFE